MANAPSPNDLTRQQLDELDALLQRMLALPQDRPTPAPSVPPPNPIPLPDPVPGPAAEAQAPASWRTDRPAGPPSNAPHLAAAPTAEPEPADVLEALAGVPRSDPAATPYPYGSPISFAPAVPPTPAVPFAPTEPVIAARLFGPPTPDTGVPPPDAAPAGFDPIPLAPAAEAGRTPRLDDFGPLEINDVKPTADEPVAVTSGGPSAPIPAAGETPVVPGVPVPLWPLFAVNWVLETILGLFGPPGQALTSPGMKHFLGWVGILLLAAAGAWTARGMGWVQLPLP